MSKRRLALASTLVAAVIGAVGAGPASAFTVTGGPSFTGTAGTTTITDNNTSISIVCSSSTIAGTVTDGTSVAGAGLGSVTSLGLSSCSAGPLGSLSATANTLPYAWNATSSTVGGVTPGTMSGTNIRLSGGCNVTVTGTAPQTYDNATQRLRFTAGTTLTASSVTGCLSLFNNGDSLSFTTTYTLTGSPTNPIQISSPPPHAVTGGPSFTGTAGTTTIRDDTTAVTLVTCSSSAIGGTVTDGTSVPGTGLGSVTSLTFGSTPCSGPAGLSFTPTANLLPYAWNATSATSSGVTAGTVTGMSIQSSGGCTFTAAGTVPQTYSNATQKLVFSAGGTLVASGVSGLCFGLVNNGDVLAFGASYTLTGSPTNPIQIN